MKSKASLWLELPLRVLPILFLLLGCAFVGSMAMLAEELIPYWEKRVRICSCIVGID